MTSPNATRFEFLIPDEMRQQLEALSQAHGLSMGEILRRGFVLYLAKTEAA